MAGPGRPFTTFSSTQQLNGTPVWLGAIVSTGAATNNATTATPFNATPLGGTANPNNLTNTLAGKVLLLQTTAAGLIMLSTSAGMGGNDMVVAQQTTLPPLASTAPGVALLSAERVIIFALSTTGWLQWLPASGSANLLVWELL